MKKRIIALLSVILTVSMLLCACGTTTPPEPEIINSEKAQTTVGSYSIFRTQDVQEYLKFLEDFDETKYEIIDVSTSLNGNLVNGSDEFYIVTYKTIVD